METFFKVFLTATCYFLLIYGIYTDDTWIIVAGAFLAGSTTTKLISELLEEKRHKKGASSEEANPN